MEAITGIAPRLLGPRGLLLLALLLAGCSTGGRSTTPPSPTGVATAATAAAGGQTGAALAATAVTALPTSSSPSPPPSPTAAILPASTPGPPAACEPTPPDALGPFYKPDAPARESVGQGYMLTGTVRAAGGCRPLPGARIEFWLANEDGEYDDDHRATVQAGPGGEYRFESNNPPPYSGRPPHIHIRVSAPGLALLVTQHYPQPGQTAATFDLVLAAR